MGHFVGTPKGESLISIEVQGNSMLPLYRHGDILLVTPKYQPKVGDRVFVESRTAGRVGGTLAHLSPNSIVINRGGSVKRELSLSMADVTFFGKVEWASQ